MRQFFLLNLAPNLVYYALHCTTVKGVIPTAYVAVVAPPRKSIDHHHMGAFTLKNPSCPTAAAPARAQAEGVAGEFVSLARLFCS
jgi:hypothetical protein